MVNKLLVKLLANIISPICWMVLITLAHMYFLPLSYAQWIIPPPMPSLESDTSNCCDNDINRNDTQPPKITILTDILYEGNNVLKLKILDDSPLNKTGISYSVGKKIVTTNLAKDNSIAYKALIKVQVPSTIVDVSAVDLHGNYAKSIKEIKVEKGNIILSTIMNPEFWNKLFFWK